MSRFEEKVSRFTGTNDRDGTRARIRESGQCPVPFPVPFWPVAVPIGRPDVKPAAWGVLHEKSHRLDGWYFNESDAMEMVEFFRTEFPNEEFKFVSRGQNESIRMPALRVHDAYLWAKPRNGRGRSMNTNLTPREAQVFDGIVAGLRDKQIAEKLGLSYRTVQGCARRLYQRIGVRNRYQAMLEAQRRGLW